MNNQIRKTTWVLALVGVLLGNVLKAQDQLSLSQAIEMGLANNFSIQIEKSKQEQAANLNTWGQAGMFPNISFNASPSINYQDTETDNPFRFGGSNVSTDVTPSIQANWVLFDGLNVRMTKGKLALLEEQSGGNALIIIENTVQAIILAYYTVLLEERRTEVFANTLNLSRDRYDYVKLKGDLGSAVTFDILRDKNSYLTDSSNYITQVLNHKNAIRNLNLLLAEEVNKEYVFLDSLAIQDTEFSLDELAAAMKSSNSNLRNQYVNLEIIQKDIGIARSAMYPRLTLNLAGSNGWNHLELGTPIGAPPNETSAINTTTLSLSANLTLAFTLYNGGKIKNQIKNARIQEQIGQLQIKDLELTLDNSLLSTYDRYNLRQNLNSIAAVNLETADLNLDMGEERYRNGSINSFNYRDLQITYLQTALIYYQSIYDLIESKTELLRLSGGILSDN
ncbi:TolC family protein [Reichenbachiella sp.]|uniref:TolC family protein n=1 Tax=Reichenbachiella sp. TaxID=2184521 RepID=UPI003B5A502F